MYIGIYLYMYIGIYKSIYMYIGIYKSIYMYIGIYKSIYMYIGIYLYIFHFSLANYRQNYYIASLCSSSCYNLLVVDVLCSSAHMCASFVKSMCVDFGIE